MINTLENPPQDVIQERVTHAPAIIGSSARLMAIADSMGFCIVPGLAARLLP